MPKKRYRPEEIISKLREADVLISQGKKVVEVILKGQPMKRVRTRFGTPSAVVPVAETTSCRRHTPLQRIPSCYPAELAVAALFSSRVSREPHF